jgi:hypothetical protein
MPTLSKQQVVPSPSVTATERQQTNVLAVNRKMDKPHVWSHPAFRRGPSIVECTKLSVFLKMSR